ncbi:MAG: shikimate dehydrogenase [Gammaproteobacteria bacterium RIFCSPHIGHO2_12_FULL_41_15]|nr:MAG: shikimate dehydrogenase [Gammaproteobacteria bacterium RIFCSPHIGHO2_12_FULL_41_15]
MLIAVIPVKNYHTAQQQITQVCQQVDGVELRLDYLTGRLDFRAIALLRHSCVLPVILTLRKKSQGGLYDSSEEQRLRDILALCQLNPDYIDIEYDIPMNFVQDIKLRYPNIKLICSYHHFDETPKNLTTILQSLQHPCFYSYKIATKTNTTSEVLRLLQFVKTFHEKCILTGIGMGEEGQVTRIINPIVGNAMNYISVDKSQKTATGQLTLNDLAIYPIKKLNSESKIYALLGDPVHSSMGHIVHNQAMVFLRENAVYVKLRVNRDELPNVIDQCRQLPFAGFSITTPLKECIVPLLDEVERSFQPIKAINSIAVHQGKYKGWNTDGIGALQVLSEKVNLAKQRIVILGAGGVARAIAYEAIRHHATVIILNRTLNKAKQLAREFGCLGYDLNYLRQLKKTGYTIIINTLPNDAYAEQDIKALFCADHLLPHTLAMDVVYQPIHTSFLTIAKNTKSVCIPGYKMFIHQALLQIKRWFHPKEAQCYQLKHIMQQWVDN